MFLLGYNIAETHIRSFSLYQLFPEAINTVVRFSIIIKVSWFAKIAISNYVIIVHSPRGRHWSWLEGGVPFMYIPERTASPLCR